MTIKSFFYNVDFPNQILLPKDNKNKILKIQETIKSLDALNIIHNQKLLDHTITEIQRFSINKKKFIIFGIGGSNLGAKALIDVLQKNISVNIDFFDNIDPISFENSINSMDLNNTGFIIISKSGETLETLSQFACLIELFEQKKSLYNLYKNTLIVTEDNENSLLKIAKLNQCKILKHEKNIGGRYSIFSNVGMIPAIIAGIDVKKIHAGALEELNNVSSSDFLKIGQFFRYQNFTNYLSNNVVMTYSDALFYFGKWYLQLWAESLGKNGKGITAIHSVGATDQHSQLQLYLDGPKDKFFTFITTNHAKKGIKLNKKIMKEIKINCLIDKTMGDLMEAEQNATIETFKKNKLIFREINLNTINENSIGKLMAYSIKETIAICEYFGVNPFNQPAVEESKLLTKEYLS